MSTSWPKAELPAALPDELLARLRDHDNPFDDFVQARRPGASFRRRHVAAVNRGVFEKLQAAIDRYRLDTSRDPQSLTIDEVPRSGVLLVLGPRGAGKTHLVHALQLHDTGGLVIAPAHYEPHRPFAEYLLQLLVRSLEDDSHAAGPAVLKRLADWLARHVAVQALFGMTDTQWLARQTSREGGYWRGLLGWGSRALADRRELLIQSLLDPNCRTIADVCHFREHAQGDLRRIALRQVEATETSLTIGGQIRHGLYLHLVKLAFDGSTDALFDFLLDGFTQVDAPLSPSRETLVDELLAALTELFILSGCPVIFAFDALETLLSDPPDEKRCHAFFRGLAEVLDSHRGLPLFLFAEAGHWEQAQRYLSSYAQQRLQQGVPTRGHGSLRQLNLPAITADDLEQLVAARMSGLLQSAASQPAAACSRIGPFNRDDLVEIARSGANAPPLRQMLQALRDLYQERVFGDGERGAFIHSEAQTAAENGAVGVELMEAWQREHKAALRRIDTEGVGAQADAVQRGLHSWLGYLEGEGISAQGWTPSRPEIVVFGASPAFGQLTRCQWRAGKVERELGIAFLLGQKSNMPRDLNEKLRMMHSSRPAVSSLLVLWPHDLECAGPAEKHLPPATRKIWDELVTGPLTSRVVLRAIEPRTLAAWLAIQPWEAALREEGPLRPEAMRHFVAEETGDLLSLIVPQDECVAVSATA